jgi:hypothetical protein
MMRSLLTLVFVLLALTCSLAFAPLPNAVSSARTTSTTNVFLFGANKANDNSKTKKKGAPKEEKKKEPFVFLFGKRYLTFVLMSTAYAV